MLSGLKAFEHWNGEAAEGNVGHISFTAIILSSLSSLPFIIIIINHQSSACMYSFFSYVFFPPVTVVSLRLGLFFPLSDPAGIKIRRWMN